MKSTNIDSAIARVSKAASNKLANERSHREFKSTQEREQQEAVAAQQRSEAAARETAIMNSAVSFLAGRIDEDKRPIKTDDFEQCFRLFRHLISRDFPKSRQITIFFKASEVSKRLTSLSAKWVESYEAAHRNAFIAELEEQDLLREYEAAARGEISFILKHPNYKQLRSYRSMFFHLHGALAPNQRSRKTAALVNSLIDELVPQMKTPEWVLEREQLQREDEKRIAELKAANKPVRGRTKHFVIYECSTGSMQETAEPVAANA